MLVTTERPTARQIAGRAWCSLFQAARQLATLFLGGLVLVVAITTRSLWLPGYRDWAGGLSDGPLGGWWANVIIVAVADILHVIVLAPLAVAVHRFVLLGEIRKMPFFFNLASLRFAVLLALFETAKLVGVLFQLQISLIVGTLYQVVCFIVICRTLLVFPAVAIEEVAAKGLFNTATERTQGNFWLIARSLLLTVYPLAVIWALLDLVYSLSVMALLRAGVPQLLLSVCYILLNNSFKIALTGVGAMMASWLYSYAAYCPTQLDASRAV